MLLSLHLTQNYVINGREKTMRLIDAEKFEVFNATCPITKGIRSGKTAAYFYGEGCRKVLEAIDAAPTIDPESLRPTAHWIKCDLIKVEHGECTRYKDAGIECSTCNHVYDKFALWDRTFCPGCGSRMIECEDGEHR